MDKKEFRSFFGDLAKRNGFQKVSNFWLKESSECILCLVLQKSSYSNLFYLNIKIFIQGVLNQKFVANKELYKEVGHIFRREPEEFSKYFDLESAVNDSDRKQGIETLFQTFLNPFVTSGLSKLGVSELAGNNLVFLTPAIKKELETHEWD